MIRLSRSLRRRIVPVFALALAALAIQAAPAFAEATFTFTGRGFGHGIGMSQYGAKGQAEAGRGYATILAHYYQGTSLGTLGYTPGSNAETIMRVAISASDTPQSYWTVRGNNNELRVSWEGSGDSYFPIPKGASYTFFVEGGRIKVRDANSVVKKDFGVATWISVWERDAADPHGAGEVQVMQASGPWGWPNILYNGSIRMTKTSTGKLYAHNWVYMEDYVKCVVPRESPASWHQEALKAQSVAARSYAYVSKKGSSSLYDVYCTTASQVYNGWGQWKSGVGSVRHESDYLSDPAVNATAGQVVKYGSTVVQTFFHSTSGGHTDNIEKVWSGSSPQPYYVGVSDPWDACSPRHTWGPMTFTASDLRARLAGRGVSLPAEIIGIKVLSRTRGGEGRVTSMQFLGADGSSRTLTTSGDDNIGDVRSALGLYDTWFFIYEHTIRIAGADRYDTSVKISQQTFDSAPVVVIANGRAYADALAASALAGSVDGPVLLTTQNALHTGVRDEIGRLGATKVYVIGGTGVISDSVLAELEKLPGLQIGNAVERVAGVNRYETAARIGEKVKALRGPSFDGRVIVVNGRRYADAVVASGLGYRKKLPILLVSESKVPTATQAAIASVGPSKALVVGGTGVVPDQVAGNMGIPWARVAGGADRYGTAIELADYVVASEGFSWSKPTVASGTSLVDALSGGPFAGRNAGPTLFVKQTVVPSTVTSVLSSKKSLIADCYILGGTGAVSSAAQDVMEKALD